MTKIIVIMSEDEPDGVAYSREDAEWLALSLAMKSYSLYLNEGSFCDPDEISLDDVCINLIYKGKTAFDEHDWYEVILSDVDKCFVDDMPWDSFYFYEFDLENNK